MSKKLTLILALAMAALPGVAQALGLGEIKLNSALNDKFSADIQIVGATSDELDSLDVKLASLAQFSQAGLDHPEVLGQLQFVVVRNPDGTAYVHVTSTQAVREPFLDFLIDANWNNGELIREYTVLLNPQSFQTASAPKTETAPAPQQQAPVPAAPTPVPAPAPAETNVAATPAAPAAVSTPAPAAAQTETQPAAQPEASVAAAPPPPAAATQPAASPPPAAAPAVETAPAQRALGANYGPIHRGETLSSIAKQVRPDGVTLNQMMIAIYQANSEVFVHNINRMKAGYILRMPNASDVQAVSVADANAEVRAQMEAWRSNRGETTPAPTAGTAASAQPALQLVAPSSAAESSAPVPGAEKQGNGEAAAGEKPTEAESTPEEAPAPPALPPPAAQPANQAPLAVKNNSLAGVQQQAAQQNAQPGPSVLPPPTPVKNEPLAQKPKPAPAQAQESGGLLDAILNVYVLGAIVVVVLLVLVGVMLKRRKKDKPSPFSASGTARIKGADWMKQEQAGGEDKDDTAASSTTRTRSKMKKAAKQIEEDRQSEDKTVLVDPPTVAAGGDDSDKTMLMSAPPAMQDTMVGGGGSKLDVSDPMAEADFHMAYGLYDQAADVLRKALRQDPSRQDVQLKLLEVFFTAGDKDNFVAEAKKFHSAGGAGGKDWDSVAIMGRQVAPDESLFSASGSSSGAAVVDIALGTGGTDTVVSDLGDAFSASPHAPMPAAAPEPAPAAPAADNLMEFSLPDLEPTPAAPAAPAAEAPQAGGMEFNMGDLNFEPTPAAKPGKPEKAAPTLGATDEPTVATDFGTDSQVEFDKALNDLAAFVNTNVPAQPEISASPSLDDAPAPAMAAGGDEPAAASSISEIGTKLDLARAYIDMGDPDGAKSILAEVIGEGNAQQKQEAQELLKHVS